MNIMELSFLLDFMEPMISFSFVWKIQWIIVEVTVHPKNGTERMTYVIKTSHHGET